MDSFKIGYERGIIKKAKKEAYEEIQEYLKLRGTEFECMGLFDDINDFLDNKIKEVI